MYKPSMTQEEMAKGEQLKKMDEKFWMKMGYISEIALRETKSIN